MLIIGGIVLVVVLLMGMLCIFKAGSDYDDMMGYDDVRGDDIQEKR